MIKLLIYTMLYSIVSAWFNYQIIDGQDWHVAQAVLRVMEFVGILYLSKTLKFEWLDLPYILVYMLSIYWITFDLSLNIMRGLHPLYIGETSWIDLNIGGLTHWIKGLLLFYITILTIQSTKIIRYGKSK